MERTKKQTEVVDSPKKRFKKIGGGFFRLSTGRIIKPNEIFSVEPEKIPVAFRDTVVCLDGDYYKTPEPKPEDLPEKEEVFEIKHVGGGRYNVLNSVGKILNEGKVTKEQATAMIEELSKK